MTLGQVETALRQSNQNSSAGFRVSGGQEYLIQGLGRVSTVEEIGQIAVTARAGRPVFVRDVASVEIGAAVKRGEGSHKARPAVILGIQKQPGANTLALTRVLDRTLDDIERTLPAGMRIDREVFRQADFIERALENLRAALWEGAPAGDNRGPAVPGECAGRGDHAAGDSAFGAGRHIRPEVDGADHQCHEVWAALAIAIGELVDDAIIDVENVMRRLRQNARLPETARSSPMEIIYRASREIRGSVVFATLIVGLVFLPLFFLTSVEGRLLRPLGLAYVIALFAVAGDRVDRDPGAVLASAAASESRSFRAGTLAGADREATVPSRSSAGRSTTAAP